MSSETDNDHEIKIWKLKNIINKLDNLRGNGTSMITLVVPGNDLVCSYRAMLTTELGAASNIKSRVNRNSVISAITSAQNKLKLYDKAPPNGLIVYTGTAMTDNNKEKKITIDFEPFKPVNKYYKCDNVFHTEMLKGMLSSDTIYGFIIVGGDSTLFGTLCGSHKTVIHEFKADLPKKHNKGGQSAQRFGRMREEAVHRYVKTLCEMATQHYITNDMPNITGLVFGGSGELKHDMINCDFFDPRLKKLVVSVVDTSYSSMSGFNQTIDLSVDSISNLQYIKEKKLLNEYLTEVAKVGTGNNKICYGIKDTMYALTMGAIDKLIVWEELPLYRYEIKENSEDKIVYMEPEKMEAYVNDHQIDIVNEQLFTEWFANNYNKYGVTLHYVTDSTQEGLQFCLGFGGVGGLLRYNLQFETDYDQDYDDLLDENYL